MNLIARLSLILMLLGSNGPVLAQPSVQETRVIVESGDWELIGDLALPESDTAVPVVLMLNKAAGDRTVYEELAGHLADRGIGSLRLDLRGHGESINMGTFIPYENRRDPLIWDSEIDVIAATRYLESLPNVSASKLAVIGGSYSGEEMAEAGRINGYADAYVALSPGSFSDESIAGIDVSGVPWLFVVSRNEPNLREITAAVQARSESVELIIAPGDEHATRLLDDRPELAEWIAVWLERVLGSR